MVLNRTQKDRRFAPPYQHKKGLKHMAQGFLGTFIDTVADVVGQVADKAMNLGIGSSKTLYGRGPTDEIRFDRQRTLSGRHPKDNFVNYQLQANMQATNSVLAGLTAHGNGKHN